ncbi:MAG TPA: dihydrofolate reductase family protein [Mycobacteriales bacterium]|jgi:dihydrofolate reductase|nr:dihydrofolate reductase family protein [Mycobacteriales bacterium]
MRGATLVRATIADGLVDELHLFTYPIAVGTGVRLFPEGHAQTKLSLVSASFLGNGVAHLVYGPA